MNVPIEGADAKFELTAGKIEKSGVIYSVFDGRYGDKNRFIRKKTDYFLGILSACGVV